MQVTARPTGTHTDAPTDQDTRPVRLLVPTERRTDYFLSPQDTLIASNLGITRATTDDELTELVAADGPDASPEALIILQRLRNGLLHPRDIEEARAWGYHVPEDENHQEFSDQPRDRLGWWWVYDPTRMETREQRADRYVNDHRLVDMKGVARLLCRAYITIKDLKFESDHVRKILNDGDYRIELATTIATENPEVTVEQAEQQLLKEARKGILKALPPRRDRAGQSDLWSVGDIIDNGRKLERLDNWYEYNRIRQTGRPPGSKTRRRRTAS